MLAAVWEMGLSAAISPIERLVLLRVADFTGADGAFIAQPFANIAGPCGLDVATVERALVSLVLAGYLAPERDGRYVFLRVGKARGSGA
jgi:hypothetical protein